MTLLDSNIFISGSKRAEGRSLRFLFAEPYSYSIVSRIEVLGFPRLAAEDLPLLQNLLAGGDELRLTSLIANQAVLLRQTRRMSLGDAIIAATALIHSLPLVTRNVADFDHIAGLTLHPA